MLTGLSGVELDELTAEALKEIPEGHTTAVIGTVDRNKAQIVAFTNLDSAGNWRASFAVKHDWANTDTSIGARLMWSK